MRVRVRGGNNLGGLLRPRPPRGLTQPWSGNLDFPINFDLSNQFQKMTGLLQFMNQFQKMTGLHTHVPPTFTPHTKGARASRAPTTVPMGRALRARPIGSVVLPFVCGTNVGAL